MFASGKIIIIVGTLYLFYRSGILNKAINILLDLKNNNNFQGGIKLHKGDYPDYTNSPPNLRFKRQYKKIDRDIYPEDLPFELYIDEPKKRKIKLPSWAGFLILNRKWLFNFLKRDIQMRNTDPKPYDKLIESIIKEVEKLD